MGIESAAMEVASDASVTPHLKIEELEESPPMCNRNFGFVKTESEQQPYQRLHTKKIIAVACDSAESLAQKSLEMSRYRRALTSKSPHMGFTHTIQETESAISQVGSLASATCNNPKKYGRSIEDFVKNASRVAAVLKTASLLELLDATISTLKQIFLVAKVTLLFQDKEIV